MSTGLRFTLEVDGLPPDAFAVVSFHLNQSLSSLFSLDLSLVSQQFLSLEFAQCSCPLISRQGLYLKLTLPADVDILAESDNPTHYADGFHCNARSPLQGYAMPFLHSVSA